MLNSNELAPLIVSTLQGFDGGELFIEHSCSEFLKFQDGVLLNSSYSDSSGFGLRAFCGDKVLYTHSSDLSYTSVVKATEFILRNKSVVASSEVPQVSGDDVPTRDSLYPSGYQDKDFPFEKKVALLKEMYAYALSKGDNIASVSATLVSSIQKVEIIKNTGEILKDDRPMLKFGFSIVLKGEGGRSVGGTSGRGGRFVFSKLVENWKNLVDRAFRKAEVNLIAVPCPSGEMTVVLGNGWPGVLLHEAIGHGLEADFNRKGTSAFSGLIGEKVASDVVSVVDDGTIEAARGSINIDDEGTQSSYNVLIEGGVLKNYMFDLMNARLMSAHPTGNGRRESYMSVPLPRMTNTYMLPGTHTPEEIIKTVDRGIYAVDFYGGQVDITSGKFVFSASGAYLIENGAVTKPVREMTLIGDGPSVLKQISIVGNDLKLDDGVGICGKDGQSVPVCVGQPTVKVDKITVGGTA